MIDPKYLPKCVTVLDGELSIPVFLADDQIGTLFLLADGDLAYEWSEMWFSMKTRNPLSGVPSDTRDRIIGPKVNWVFDNFYLPTSEWNLRHSLQLFPFMDDSDYSDYNRRLLLFVTPYHRTGVAIGAPCSNFDSCFSTKLKTEHT